VLDLSFVVNMENSAPPPVYSPPQTSRDTVEAPPAFESGPSAPAVSIDFKPPLDLDNGSSVSPLPKRARVPDEYVFQPPSPPTLVINNKAVGPFDLVSIHEIKAHLVFLGAFARLKAAVKAQKGVDVRGSTDELWSTYLARAVDRFAAWAVKGLPTDLNESVSRLLKEEEVPPLDVLMAWHAYMLNPRVYFEDGVNKKSQLLNIRYRDHTYIHLIE
jgi:hypothetical protein